MCAGVWGLSFAKDAPVDVLEGECTRTEPVVAPTPNTRRRHSPMAPQQGHLCPWKIVLPSEAIYDASLFKDR